MAHDKRTYTVSRYDASPTWHASIIPADRKWILYVAKDGDAHLYHRTEDVADAATGDTLERYVLAGRTPDGHEEAAQGAAVLAL